jgi:hypothetical protein
MVYPSVMVVRQCRSKRIFVTFDMFEGSRGTGAQGQGIIYRLSRAGGGGVFVLGRLEGDLSRGCAACQLLLFLKLFGAGFNGYSKTDLCLLLG